MDNIILTVVVPIYKVEPYINKCLDSLIVPKDRMSSLEVIMVNDGTPDNSAEMAREYEKRFPGVFRLIDKENGGHGSAWNRGLKEAQGKYIRFLDSDDWFDNANFVRLLDRLETVDADIVFSDYNRVIMEDGSINLYPVKDTPDNQTVETISFNWAAQNMNVANFWYSTYRTALLQPLWPLFLERVSYDDSILFVVPIIRARKVHYASGVLYNYLQGRPGQSMDVNIIKKHYRSRHLTHMQVFDYYLAHESEITDIGRKEILTRILRNMLRDDFVDLSYASYSDKEMMVEWCDRCERISQTIPIPQELLECKKRFCSTPYPIYYTLRKAKRVLFDIIGK